MGYHMDAMGTQICEVHFFPTNHVPSDRIYGEPRGTVGYELYRSSNLSLIATDKRSVLRLLGKMTVD